MSTHSRIAFRNLLISWLPKIAVAYQNYVFLAQINKWREKGWVTPLPSLLKRFMIKAEARRISATCLVETGTYLGDTPWFFRKDFQQIISIEVESKLAALAAARFKNWPNVSIIKGDSAHALNQILPMLQGTTVFWLDGHYSADITGKGEKECPIMEELSAIFSRCQNPYSLMIDDARLFGRDAAYPTLLELESFMRAQRPDYQFRLENDIIFFCRSSETIQPTEN